MRARYPLPARQNVFLGPHARIPTYQPERDSLPAERYCCTNRAGQSKEDRTCQPGRDRRQRRRRAAVVGGAAVAAKKHHDAKQAQQEEAAAPQQPAPAQPSAAAGLTPEVMEQLKQLGELHEQNVLSDEEFEREKAKLLGQA